MTTRPRRPLILLAAIGVALATVAAGCGGDDAGPSTADPTTTTTTTLGTGDGTFEVRRETFVDDTRDTAGTPGRTLPTDIYVPGGEGPFPLIVHAHGMDGSSAKFSELLGGWAEAGYIVVAPNFPRTNDETPPEQRDLADYANQPGDVRFVLDQVLAEDDGGGALEGLIATDHLGVSGLSLGGATVYGTLFNSCCRDDRFESAILMSAPELPFDGGDFDHSGTFPVLAFSGTLDFTVPYESQQSVIATLPGPTWAVTLVNGLHAHPYENLPSPHDEVVAATTADFWALTLRGDEAAADRLVADATVDGVASVTFSP